jgi:hypothetical protein
MQQHTQQMQQMQQAVQGAVHNAVHSAMQGAVQGAVHGELDLMRRAMDGQGRVMEQQAVKMDALMSMLQQSLKVREER